MYELQGYSVVFAAQMASKYEKGAIAEFPKWSVEAARKLKQLEEENKAAPFGDKTKNYYLLNTYLPKIFGIHKNGTNIVTATIGFRVEGSPSASPSKRGRKKKNGDGDAQGVTNEAPGDKSPSPAPSDPSVQPLGAARAQKDDARSDDDKNSSSEMQDADDGKKADGKKAREVFDKEVSRRRDSAGLRDDDFLLEAPGGAGEENVVAVREAAARALRPPRRKVVVETESDEDTAPKKKPRQSTSQRRSTEKKQKSRTSDTVNISDDDDDELEDSSREKVGRYKKHDASSIMVTWKDQIERLRPAVQQLLLSRDGANLRIQAPHREMNLVLIYSAAKKGMSQQEYKSFKKDCDEARGSPGDQLVAFFRAIHAVVLRLISLWYFPQGELVQGRRRLL